MFTVKYKKLKCVINEKLVDIKKPDLARIKRLHKMRLYIESQMAKKTISKEDLLILRNLWSVVQFDLQEAWNFEKSAKHHRFWTLPKCSCPKMDNEDTYGYSSYISADCILHGGIDE